MEEINKITDFIIELEKQNFLELKANKEQLEILAHRYLTGQELKF